MKKLVFGIVCLLLAGVAAYWYFHRDSDKARDVLPEDANAVAILEPAELVQELGLPLDKISKLVLNFEDLMEAVDLTKPVYAFTTEKGLSGLTLNVKDADKLLKAASIFNFASEEQQGFQWIANNNSIGCIGKDKMLIFGPIPSTEQDALRGEMVKLMKQSRKDVPVLEKAKEQKGVFLASSPLSNLPKQYAKALPADADLSKTFLNCALRIEKEAIKYAANVEGVESLSIPLAPIKGNLFGMGPEKPFAWLCVNMKGEELLPLLRKVPQLRSALLALNMCVDADMMIKAIDGDVMLAMPKIETQPNVILTATLKNTDFLKNSGDWNVNRRSNIDFSVTQDGVKVFFGVRDEKLYITTSEELANTACQKTYDDDYQQNAKGKYLSASVDLEKLFETVSKGFSSTGMMLRIPQIRETVDAFERVSITADSPQNFELSLETNKPIKDIYKNFSTLLTGK